MQVGILITNGGPHSAESWALSTAEMLMTAFTVKSGSPNEAAIEMAKNRAKVAITDIMVGYHNEVQAKEREMLASCGDERCAAALDAYEHTAVEECCAAMRVAIQPLLDAAQSVEVLPMRRDSDEIPVEDFIARVIRERVELDLHTNMQVERDWHNDRKA